MNLIVASIVVSMVASITSLALMNNMRALSEAKRKALIVMAAFVLGGGIWSMHFLAMLSLQFSVPIHYDLLQTLGSGLIAVLVVGFAVLLLHFRARTRIVLNVAGISLGMGIVSMHFIGMLGMRGVHPTFNSFATISSLIVALVMGVAAVRVSYGARSRQNIVKGGIVFGLSVVVVHFAAMTGTHFTLDPNYLRLTVAIDQGMLAIAVTVAAFIICGTFLLAAATFVAADSGGTVDSPDSQPLSDQALSVENSGDDVGDDPTESVNQAAQVAQMVRIPFEEHKQIAFVSSSDVGAIRADGRYTQVYSREGVKFCPWSITEAEKRLAVAGFYRSHRSYLINTTKVAGFEKNRDAGICRFTGFANLGNVPVSRARVTEIIQRLGL